MSQWNRVQSPETDYINDRFLSKVQKEDNETKVVFSVNRVLTSKHSHKKKKNPGTIYTLHKTSEGIIDLNAKQKPHKTPRKNLDDHGYGDTFLDKMPKV